MKFKNILCTILAISLAFSAPAALYTQAESVSQFESDSQADYISYEEFSDKVNKLYEQYDEHKNLIPQKTEDDLTNIYQTARIIVKSHQEINDENALETIGPYRDIYILQYKTAPEAEKSAGYYVKQPYVDFVQPDRIMSAATESFVWNTSSVYAASTSDWAPGVCQYSVMQNVLMGKYGSVSNMPTVVVADIDSGIYANHTAFKDRILSNGKSFVGNSDSLNDTNGHGTATAGCIAMNTPSNVKILPIRLFYEDNPAYTDTGAYDSIEYAISQKADIINMSFSGGASDPLVQQAINDAANAGIIMVAAYGNNGKETSSVYPACYNHVIAVSAVNSNLFRASFSNYGSYTALSAPGENIYTTNKTGGYTIVSGTSFSCPYVSAGAALIKTYNNKLNPMQVRTILCDNVIDCGPAGWDKEYGSGVLCFANIQQYLSSPANDTLTHEKMSVMYITNGGTSVSAQTVDYGSTISAPSVSKNGYHLVGWYTNTSLTKEFSFSSRITSDLTLYAKWEKHKYNEKKSSILKKATYTAKGKKQYKCTVCGKGEYTVTLPLIKLKTPKLKSVSKAGQCISVSWKKVTGASGYYIYRKSGKSKWRKIKTIKKPKTLTYIDKSIKSGVSYKYRIRAYNKAQKSNYSSEKLCK